MDIDSSLDDLIKKNAKGRRKPQKQVEGKDRNSQKSRTESAKKFQKESSQKRAGKFDKARGLNRENNNQNNNQNNQKGGKKGGDQNQPKKQNQGKNDNRQVKAPKNNNNNNNNNHQKGNQPLKNFKITVKNSSPAKSAAKRFAPKRTIKPTAKTQGPSRVIVQSGGIRKRTKAPVARAAKTTTQKLGAVRRLTRATTSVRKPSAVKVKTVKPANGDSNASTLNERFGGKKLVVKRGLKGVATARGGVAAGGRRVILKKK